MPIDRVMKTNAEATIIDIRKPETSQTSLQTQIQTSLSHPSIIKPDHGLVRSIPTIVLYDKKGLEIFDKITYEPEYYLTEAEIDIFKRYGEDIVKEYVEDGGVIVELGVGAMRKTKYILEAITSQNKSITYYALDLDEPTLRASLTELTHEFPNIKFIGLHGTYDDSLEYIQTLPMRKVILWLGSSIGNFTRSAAKEFVGDVGRLAMNIGDLFFIGIDQRNEPSIISKAYNDSKMVTQDFILNGLSHINTLFPQPILDPTGFTYHSKYNELEGRHEAYYQSKIAQNITFPDSKQIHIRKGEFIHVEYSYKYSDKEVLNLLDGLTRVCKLSSKNGLYSVHILQKPPFYFELNKAEKAVPEWKDFEKVFNAWDKIQTLIPDLHEKPISLRYPYIFYRGHNPAFMDRLLSTHLKEKPTEPEAFKVIFERGIDPDIEDLSINHSHSEVPEIWPTIQEINAYDKRVRHRVKQLYAENKGKGFVKRMARILNLGLEHWMMHLETLLYMIVQSPNIIPPTDIHAPIFIESNTQQPIPKAKLTDIQPKDLSYLRRPFTEDSDSNEPATTPFFNWDNESIVRIPPSKPFKIQNRPVTIGEYFNFLKDLPASEDLSLYIPKSWKVNKLPLNVDEIDLKTVFGLVPIKRTWNYAVSVSNSQGSKYALVKGMRLPTESELGCCEGTLGNYGFNQWMPNELDVSGKAGFQGGGGWELTGTVFDGYDGFKASELYPGYSADFFDEKHNVCIGGSWATHPFIAERRSFRNWYQRGYGYVFTCFRCVKD